jgi:hypothetical protein
MEMRAAAPARDASMPMRRETSREPARRCSVGLACWCASGPASVAGVRAGDQNSTDVLIREIEVLRAAELRDA